VVDEEDLTLAGQAPHSPGYASPEQREPGRALTPASDVYQLGLVAYELFTGERPFDEEQRDRIAAGDRVPLPHRGQWNALAPELREAIERALQPDPAARFADASALAEVLATVPDDWRLEEDRTLLAPEEDRTVIAPPPASASDSLPRTQLRDEPVVHPVRPSSPARAERDGARSRFAWMPGQLGKFAVGIALVVLGLWGLGLIGGGGGEEAEAPEALDLGSIELEFQELYHRAHRNLLDAGAAEEGDEAAAAVGRVISDSQEAFVQGDLERHISHYADRVSFHNQSNVARSRIERDRRADLERYTDREIVLERQAIEFPEPRRARALIDRSWDFRGPAEHWSGMAARS
jgi:hypothetical protein